MSVTWPLSRSGLVQPVRIPPAGALGGPDSQLRQDQPQFVGGARHGVGTRQRVAPKEPADDGHAPTILVALGVDWIALAAMSRRTAGTPWV
jgi:hypothetical protein